MDGQTNRWTILRTSDKSVTNGPTNGPMTDQARMHLKSERSYQSCSRQSQIIPAQLLAGENLMTNVYHLIFHSLQFRQ